jgi:hypothetical protein
MKKLLFLTAIALLTVNISISQEDTSSDLGIRFGAKAGANFATLSKDEGFKPDMKTGFHVGGVVNIGISEKFSVQPEVVYSSQGFKEKSDGVTYTAKLNYINVPIMAEYKIIDGLTAQAGPQFGINVTAKDDDGNDINDIKTLDIGVGFGAQYELDFGLFFQARYVLGLNKISDVDGGGDFKNRVISLSAGYFFN